MDASSACHKGSGWIGLDAGRASETNASRRCRLTAF